MNFCPGKRNSLTEEEKREDVPLPSWIPNASEFPFKMRDARRNTVTSTLPSVASDPERLFIGRMDRQRGDSFGGWPEQKVYSASGTRPYSKDKLRFRPRGDHYSMFVEGFILDHVNSVQETSQSGQIPGSWFGVLARNTPRQSSRAERFEEFARTLVGNRDQNGNVSPIHCPRALGKILDQAGHQDTLDTDRWIRMGEGPIASFLRRVKSNIWNRRLMTTQNGLLGLADSKVQQNDVICILYGCSVPVVLHRCDKSRLALLQEEKDDEEADKKLVDEAFERVRQISEKRKVKRRAQDAKQPSLLGRLRKVVKGIPTYESPQTSGKERARQRTSSRLDMIGKLIYSLRNLARTICLLLLSWWLAVQRMQLLASVLVLVVAILHAISSGKNGITRMAALMSVVIPCAHFHTFGLSSTSPLRTTLELIIVCLVFLVLFANLLPRQLWHVIMRLRDKFEYRYERIRGNTKPNQRATGVEPYYYTMVGECYVDGVMDGEAIDWQFRHRTPQEKPKSLRSGRACLNIPDQEINRTDGMSAKAIYLSG